MSNTRQSSATRNNMTCTARNPLLPPKCPFSTPSYAAADYITSPSASGPNITLTKHRYGNNNSHHHHRTSSESVAVEDQPYWLDDLLTEPETETSVQRGHRRASSDSFAYLEAVANAEYVVKNEQQQLRNLSCSPSWGFQEFLSNDARNRWCFADQNIVMRNNLVLQRSVSLGGVTQKVNGIVSSASENQDAGEARFQDANASSERNDCCNIKNSASEADTKRAKQQFAQRSRVRKLQYIAELERNVHALQSEGIEVSAQLEFLNQQSLILGMENKALKQRLENLAQEQLIKRLEHEVLEREIGRLRALYQQQQQPPPQPQQPPKSHRRTASHDRLDFQFANLTLKNKDARSIPDPVSSKPRT